MVGSSKAQARLAPSDREQAELIRGLYRNVPVGVAGALFGVAVLCWVLVYMAPDRRPEVELWFAMTLVAAAWQVSLWGWYLRTPVQDADWRVWGRRFVIASLIEGVRWGFGSLWLAAPGHPEQQVWVCMVVACAASSSVSSLGSYVPAFYALLFPAMLPFVAWGALQDDPRYRALALMAFVLTTSIAWLGYGQSRSLAEALRLRFENLDLADDLRSQKEAAEQANLAKTQFLASASHDLRQPIHALGMFVAALGRQRKGADNGRLVSQIAETVEAMTGLFDSLLDISQLDAGVVKPTARTFALQPMLDRICREEAIELQGRPVRLKLARSSAVVHTDPVLLERMVRNVISNAVRHTRRGKILVGCRRGGRVSIVVCDTGPGIPLEHQEQVFQEYYQLANPERDRAKGLGLGLAITRRLSMLLDCPVVLRSQAGHGATFQISVPLGDPARLAEQLSAGAQAPATDGLILVVDDEATIQQGTADLLTAWGYEVVVAGSGIELMAKVDPARRPDLLICDWRLRAHATAPEVVASVRGLYGDDVPALLITGDTAPSRLRDAYRTGFVLLHKPVAPGKLRAAIGNLTGRRTLPDPAEVR